jgi:hypothetical protein
MLLIAFLMLMMLSPSMVSHFFDIINVSLELHVVMVFLVVMVIADHDLLINNHVVVILLYVVLGYMLQLLSNVDKSGIIIYIIFVDVDNLFLVEVTYCTLV